MWAYMLTVDVKISGAILAVTVHFFSRYLAVENTSLISRIDKIL